MRGVLKAVLPAVFVFLLILQPVSGISVSTFAVNHGGVISEGTLVTVDFSIDFLDNSDAFIPPENELVIDTELEDPQWTWFSDHDEIQPWIGENRTLVVPIKNFSLSEYSRKILRVRLNGITPYVSQDENRTLIRIRRSDTGDILVRQTALVIDLDYIRTLIPNLKKRLENFRTEIDNKAAMGVNTTEVELLYRDADAHLSTASALTINTYTNALGHLNSAERLITEGERLLDRAWAEKEIMDAQIPIMNADKTIGRMTRNGTSPPPQVVEIISKREEAVRYIGIANDQIAAGNYSAARQNAGIASALGNQSYTIALDYVQQESRPAGTPLSPWGCIAAVSLAGIIIFRKRLRG